MARATDNQMGGGGGQPGVGGNPWRRLWQVPLLLIAVAVFGMGLRELVKAIKPVPFEQQEQAVRKLLDLGEYARAVEQINTLGAFYKEPRQQGQLQVLAGDAHFLAQQAIGDGGDLNYRRVQEHYTKAQQWGVPLSARTNERWGVAALALGDARTGVEKLESAIAGLPAGLSESLVKAHGRKLVAAYLELGRVDDALVTVDRVLAAHAGAPPEDLATLDERTWALCKRIEIALHQGGTGGGSAVLDRVVSGAREALGDIGDRDREGRVLGWIGRAELERGNWAAAQRDLTAARERFTVRHLDDGRAAVLLARLAMSRGEWDEAARLFDEVVTVHAGTSIWAAGRLGRAEVMSRSGGSPAPAATAQSPVEDFTYAVRAVTAEQEVRGPAGNPAEMITRGMVRGAIVRAYERAIAAGRHEAALAYLGLAQELDAGLSADVSLVLRQAISREQLANEALGESQRLKSEGDHAGATAMEDRAARHFAGAAEDYERHARLTTLNDEQSGASLWKAGEMWDRAGETDRGIAVYQRFTIQRPRDPRVSEGLLALGRLYESAGMFHEALGVYERNLREHPKTPGAYSSVVRLARCYAWLADREPLIEPRETWIHKAEAALLSLVQNNVDLRPEAAEFRESLLALGELYYRHGRWGEAILRLDEAARRYPDDPALPRVLFLLAQSYRHSAAEIIAALESDPGMAHRSALERARAERLQMAAGEFTRVIGLLDAEWPRETQSGGMVAGGKLSPLEETYLRRSYMDRAECHFDRGEFQEAIGLFDQAATRFSEEILAVEANVRIVNGYMALNQPAQARAAAQRGLWVLQRMPEEAFTRDVLGAPRSHYERLLALGRN